MKLSALLAPLLDAKADHELIRAQLLAFEAEQTDALERRRKADAERQARKRSRDVTVRHSDRSLVRDVEDKSLSSEIEPKKEEVKKAARGTRLPSDFVLPDEWFQWALRRGLPAHRIPIEFEKLTNWAANAPPSKAVKPNWFRAWQNWVISAIDALPRDGPKLVVSKPTLAGGFGRMADEMAEKQNAIRSSESGGGVQALIPDLSAVSGR